MDTINEGRDINSKSNVSSSSTSNSIERLVRSRVASWEYLRDVHHGDRLWMNVVALSPVEVDQVYHTWEGGDANATLETWFVLGSTLGRVLAMSLDGASLVRAVNQTLLELDFHFASAPKQSVKMLMARDQGHFPQAKHRTTRVSAAAVSPSSSAADTVAWASRVSLRKVGSTVSYEYLQARHTRRHITAVDTHTHVAAGNFIQSSMSEGVPQDVEEPRELASSSLTEGSGGAQVPVPEQSYELNLCATEVVFALCEVLRQLYTRFFDPQFLELLPAIISLDSALRSLVLEPFCREANRVATAVLKREMGVLVATSSSSGSVIT